MNSSKKVLFIGHSGSLAACSLGLGEQSPKKVIMIDEAWRTSDYVSHAALLRVIAEF